MPPKFSQNFWEAVRLVRWPWRSKCAREAGPRFQRIDGAKCKQTSRGVESEAVAAREAPSEVLIATQRAAAEAVAAAPAALAVVEGAKKAAVKAAAAAPDLADVVGGRCNRRQAQAVWVQQDAAKAHRKARMSHAHKSAALAFLAEI
jgi:hypothetical protein